ncbi:hypothetical protein BamMEX5DRAFT_2081 [Burkholderia ambifaria MEX-5]|uniref:Uncharacterized protein n=1 Tax=Burkholderia ambifaria MEX-5 TaxID=396597 RepID=B1T2R5_9BURK|nr:hypothetical protein BamMEX5DRAFT_2081 [Burkholderia ambifaria MEX-5]
MLVPQKLGRSSGLFQLCSYFNQFGLSLPDMLTGFIEAALECLLRLTRCVRFRSRHRRPLLSFHACGALFLQCLPHALEVLLQARHCLESKQRLCQVRPCGFCSRTLGGRVVSRFVALGFHLCKPPRKLSFFRVRALKRRSQILNDGCLSFGFDDEVRIGLARYFKVCPQLTLTSLNLRRNELQQTAL